MKNNSIYFFDTGHIEFKGVMIPTCEVVFNEKERYYKEKISEEMVRLYNTIKENHWEQRIFHNLMEILFKLAHTLPAFSITPREPIHGMQTVTNESYMMLCRKALKAYNADEDYNTAVEFLHHIIAISEQIPLFDRLVLDYMRGISDKYTLLLEDFRAYIDKEVDEKADQIFQGNYYKAWLAAKNGSQMFEKLKIAGRKSPDISKKKNIWLNLIAQNKEKMVFTLYSGKK
jgi:hypothetical protein